MAVLPLLFLVLLTLSQSATAATAACKSQTFKAKTFENCADLPALGASLHYTFDAKTSSLSMAFVAAPTAKDGWVAWGLNPTATGMMGTQAIIAGKFVGSSSVTANTIDIQSYHALVKGPISYNVTGVSAEESTEGKITIFGDWTIPAGALTVNQVWQVGPIDGGKPGKHNMDKDNLSSRMKLSLTGGAVAAEAPEPVAAVAPEPVGSMTEETHTPVMAPEPVKTTSTPATGAGETLFFSYGLGLVALVVYSLF